MFSGLFCSAVEWQGSHIAVVLKYAVLLIRHTENKVSLLWGLKGTKLSGKGCAWHALGPRLNPSHHVLPTVLKWQALGKTLASDFGEPLTIGVDTCWHRELSGLTRCTTLPYQTKPYSGLHPSKQLYSKIKTQIVFCFKYAPRTSAFINCHMLLQL